MGWKEIGVFAGFYVESGVADWNSTVVRWDAIEGDYLWPSQRNYGPGLSLIQETSSNGLLLRYIRDNGVDITGLSLSLQSQIASKNYIGSFSYSDTAELKRILVQDKAKEMVFRDIREYFDDRNRVLTSKIGTSSMPDICKAYTINLLILYPAGVQSVINANPQTLNEVQNACARALPSSYANSLQTLTEKFQEFIEQGVNFTTDNPPVNPWEGVPPGDDDGGDDDGTSPSRYNGLYVKVGYFLYKLGDKSIKIKVHFLKDKGVCYDVNHKLKFQCMGKFWKLSGKTKGEDMGGSGEANSPSGDIVDAISEMLSGVGNNNYQMVRPVGPNPQTSPFDCSGAVCFALRFMYPTLWNNGFCGNTNTLYNFFTASIILSTGVYQDIQNFDFRPGDIILMGSSSNYGAGGTSHTGMMTSNNIFTDFGSSRTGWKSTDIKQYLNNYHPWIYYTIIRL